jgi:hypothetical protein
MTHWRPDVADDTTIDIDTLEEVHRLLATTEFASVHDLARRGLDDVEAPAPAARRTARPTVVAGDGGALPRRR